MAQTTTTVQAVATVAKVDGFAIVRHANGTQEVIKVGAQLSLGDVVVTAAGAVANIQLAEGGSVKCGGENPDAITIDKTVLDFFSDAQDTKVADSKTTDTAFKNTNLGNNNEPVDLNEQLEATAAGGDSGDVLSGNSYVVLQPIVTTTTPTPFSNTNSFPTGPSVLTVPIPLLINEPSYTFRIFITDAEGNLLGEPGAYQKAESIQEEIQDGPNKAYYKVLAVDPATGEPLVDQPTGSIEVNFTGDNKIDAIDFTLDGEIEVLDGIYTVTIGGVFAATATDDFWSDNSESFDISITPATFSGIGNQDVYIDNKVTTTIIDETFNDELPEDNPDADPDKLDNDVVNFVLYTVTGSGTENDPYIYTKAVDINEDGGTGRYIVFAEVPNPDYVDGEGEPEFLRLDTNGTLTVTASGGDADSGDDYEAVDSLEVTVGAEFTIDALDDYFSDNNETFNLLIDPGSWTPGLDGVDFEKVAYDDVPVVTTIIDETFNDELPGPDADPDKLDNDVVNFVLYTVTGSGTENDPYIYTKAVDINEDGGTGRYIVFAEVPNPDYVDGEGEPEFLRLDTNGTLTVTASGGDADSGDDYEAVDSLEVTVGAEFTIDALDDYFSDNNETFNLLIDAGSWTPAVGGVDFEKVSYDDVPVVTTILSNTYDPAELVEPNPDNIAKTAYDGDDTVYIKLSLKSSFELRDEDDHEYSENEREDQNSDYVSEKKHYDSKKVEREEESEWDHANDCQVVSYKNTYTYTFDLKLYDSDNQAVVVPSGESISVDLLWNNLLAVSNLDESTLTVTLQSGSAYNYNDFVSGHLDLTLLSGSSQDTVVVSFTTKSGESEDTLEDIADLLPSIVGIDNDVFENLVEDNRDYEVEDEHDHDGQETARNTKEDSDYRGKISVLNDDSDHKEHMIEGGQRLKTNFNLDNEYYDVSKKGEHGTLYLKSWDGSYVYVADDDENGSEDFNVLVTSGSRSGLLNLSLIIDPVNDAPTFTTISGAVATGSEDVQKEITFDNIKSNGDEADVDGTVTAFVVKSVTTGTLLIGTSAGTATAWVASTNDHIDATHNAYWTGAANASGTLNAFTVVAEDNDGATSSLPAEQVTVTLNSVNDAPSVALGAAATFTENGSAVTVASAATVSDVDSANFSNGSLKVQITSNGTVADQLDINVSNPSLITLSTANNVTSVKYNSTTIGTLDNTHQGNNGDYLLISLGNSATPTNVQALVRAITFSNTSENPSALQRTVTFTLNDGDAGLSPAVITTTVNVTPVNDAPTTNIVSGSGGEDTTISVVLTGADVDGSVSSFKIISLPSGTDGRLYADAALTDEITLNETVTANGNSATLYFVPTLNYSGMKTFQYVSIDSNGEPDATPAEATVTVNAVNDAPSVALGAAATFTENGSAVTVASAATVSDVDSANFSNGSLKVQITSNGTVADQLDINVSNPSLITLSTANNVTSVKYNSTTIGTLDNTHQGNNGDYLLISLGNSATPTNVQALVRAITFSNTSENPSALQRTVTFTLNDGDAGLSPAVITTTVNVTPVNDAPTLAGITSATVADSTTSSSLGSTTNLSGTLSATDVDGDTLTYGLTGSSVAAHTLGSVTYNLSKSGSYGMLYLESSSGKYVYVPDAALVNALATGTNPTESFIMSVSDGIASAVTKTFTVNIIGADEMTGTANNDTIRGTASADTISGLAGDDTLSGLAGDDTIDGGEGADMITGGAGTDRLTGASGRDTFVLDDPASVDTITDFTLGSGEDIIQIGLSAFKANFIELVNAGSTSLTSATGTDLAYLTVNSATQALTSTDNIFIVTGSTFTNDDAGKSSLIKTFDKGSSDQVTFNSLTDDNDIVVVWSDGKNSYVGIWNLDEDGGQNSTPNTIENVSNTNTITTVAILEGLTNLSSIHTDNFVFIA
ncbi:RTX calcium-binding nonapeptide repeat [Methylophilaceae bacterium]